MQHTDLLRFIRDVPDFPKPGVTFKDHTPLLADPRSLALAVELMANPWRGTGVELVCGAESRGFIFGVAVAQALSVGFVPIRKPGKLPRQTLRVGYSLEYGDDQLEIHADALPKGARVLVVDDVLATGGTLRACASLVASSAARLAGLSVLLEIGALRGRELVKDLGVLEAVLVL